MKRNLIILLISIFTILTMSIINYTYAKYKFAVQNNIDILTEEFYTSVVRNNTNEIYYKNIDNKIIINQLTFKNYEDSNYTKIPITYEISILDGNNSAEKFGIKFNNQTSTNGKLNITIDEISSIKDTIPKIEITENLDSSNYSNQETFTIIVKAVAPYEKELISEIFTYDMRPTIEINSEDDFIYYLNDNINTYSNYNFVQTKDLYLTNDYSGISDQAKFNGIYDGNGYTITIKTDNATGITRGPFPKITGLVMNLGIVGKIVGSNVGSFTVGINGTGAVINSWSTAEVAGNHRPGGISCYTEGGLIANVYYAGALTGPKRHDHEGPLVAWSARHSSGKTTYFNNYYLLGIDFTNNSQTQAIKMTEEEMKSQTLVDLLNNGREETARMVASKFNITVDHLLTWTIGTEGYPILIQE